MTVAVARSQRNHVPRRSTDMGDSPSGRIDRRYEYRETICPSPVAVNPILGSRGGGPRASIERSATTAREAWTTMTSFSIIGTGTMANAIGGVLADGGSDVG